MIEHLPLFSHFVFFCLKDIERDVSLHKTIGLSLLCWHTFEICSWCVGFNFLSFLPVQKTDKCLAATSSNATSLSLSYKLPVVSATITAKTQTSSPNYIYGACANASALSPAYTTVSSLVNTCSFVIITAEAQLSDLTTCSYNTTIVSTIAPSATCCTKCEIGADKVRLVYVKSFPPHIKTRVATHYLGAKSPPAHGT